MNSRTRSSGNNETPSSLSKQASEKTKSGNKRPLHVEPLSPPKRLKTLDATRWAASGSSGQRAAGSSSTARGEYDRSHNPPHLPSPATQRVDPFLNNFFNPSTHAKAQGENHSLPKSSVHASPVKDACITDLMADDSDSEEDEEWEEVDVENTSSMDFNQPLEISSETADEGFEISIKRAESNSVTGTMTTNKPKSRGIRKEDRLRRMLIHKVHLLCLLSCGLFRNRWCNDEELQAVVVSIVPEDIYAGLTGQQRGTRTGKGKATAGQRPGHREKLLTHYLNLFARWWKDQVRAQGTSDSQMVDGPATLLDIVGAYMAKTQEDPTRFVSAEVSGLLFTAACRAMKLETRLVCSLHPIPLSLSNQKAAIKPSGRSSKMTRQTRRLSDRGSDSEVYEGASSRSSSVGTATGNPNGSTTVLIPYPLRCWCEIYSQVDKEWVPVDPSRGIVKDTEAMEPPASAMNQLQISYVVGYEQGFGVKDLTRRYTSQWGARTVRLRLPPGQEGEGWWEQCLWLYSKSDRNEVDKNEDEQLKKLEVDEKMPTSLAGFKDHALYALERHLKKYEVVHPHGKAHAIGRFKNELVYPRSHVKQLHTAETWLKRGRRVKCDVEPVKHVKARVATITRKRQIEAEKLDDPRGREELGPEGDSSMSAVFGEWQTEEFVAEPLVDGKIPRNAFGNIEIFHRNMLPIGAVHLQLNGVGRLAKKLGIDYANAVVGFEFHAGRSTPVINGIVVAEEFEDILIAAYEENLQLLREQEIKKRQRRVYIRWKKLIVSVLTKERLMREYMVDEDGTQGDTADEEDGDSRARYSENTIDDGEEDDQSDTAGPFADDEVGDGDGSFSGGSTPQNGQSPRGGFLPENDD
ncbi:hypothetical protein SpCBS45565_g06575 [Spizellomyces sp. 'palustris']|nr:hypothetical protein SpCBS45565_g06575 [Spizellomyces sp. 'palustris']